MVLSWSLRFLLYHIYIVLITLCKKLSHPSKQWHCWYIALRASETFLHRTATYWSHLWFLNCTHIAYIIHFTYRVHTIWKTLWYIKFLRTRDIFMRRTQYIALICISHIGNSIFTTYLVRSIFYISETSHLKNNFTWI